MYLRHELAHFNLDDGVLQLDLQELLVSLALSSRSGRTAVGGEDPQYPHVAAHHHLVCKDKIHNTGMRQIAAST